MEPTSRDGEYARRVEKELRTRCVHLLTKEAFLGPPEDHEREFEADDPIWWCDRTSEPLGPDGREACAESCRDGRRPCYEPPVRL